MESKIIQLLYYETEESIEEIKRILTDMYLNELRDFENKLSQLETLIDEEIQRKAESVRNSFRSIKAEK